MVMLLICACAFGYLFGTTLVTFFKYETNVDVAVGLHKSHVSNAKAFSWSPRIVSSQP